MAASLVRELFQPKVLLLISLHWTVAISLVFVNKQLVSARNGGHDLTVFIAWSQCLFSVASILAVVWAKRCLNPSPSRFRVPMATFFQSDVLAMTFTFIGVIIMNNLLLKYISVAFYQVARSSTLIFTVIFSRFYLGVPVTLPVVASCLLIVVGFVISVDQEMILSSLSLTSIFYGLLASLSAALGGIFTKRAVKFVDGDTLSIALTSNANSVLFLFPLLLTTGQFQLMVSSEFLDSVTWLKLAATGVLSLMTGWVGIKVISLTSPLTHNMSINAKSMVQTLIAVLLEGQPKTGAWWLGNCLVILGIMNYGLSRNPPSASALGPGAEASRMSAEDSVSEAEAQLKKRNMLNA